LLESETKTPSVLVDAALDKSNSQSTSAMATAAMATAASQQVPFYHFNSSVYTISIK